MKKYFLSATLFLTLVTSLSAAHASPLEDLCESYGEGIKLTIEPIHRLYLDTQSGSYLEGSVRILSRELAIAVDESSKECVYSANFQVKDDSDKSVPGSITLRASTKRKSSVGFGAQMSGTITLGERSIQLVEGRFVGGADTSIAFTAAVPYADDDTEINAVLIAHIFGD